MLLGAGLESLPNSHVRLLILTRSYSDMSLCAEGLGDMSTLLHNHPIGRLRKPLLLPDVSTIP